MIKKIIIHLLIGGVIFIFGAVLHDLAEIIALGNFIAYSGISYAVLSAGIILFKGKPMEFIEKSAKEREKNKAQDDLLKYKKLLNEGIISQEEFAIKLEELKKQIL